MINDYNAQYHHQMNETKVLNTERIKDDKTNYNNTHAENEHEDKSNTARQNEYNSGRKALIQIKKIKIHTHDIRPTTKTNRRDENNKKKKKT